MKKACTILTLSRHQMQGREVVFIPGSDHAGIATQVVVERHLWATQRKTKHDLGREK